MCGTNIIKVWFTALFGRWPQAFQFLFCCFLRSWTSALPLTQLPMSLLCTHGALSDSTRAICVDVCLRYGIQWMVHYSRYEPQSERGSLGNMQTRLAALYLWILSSSVQHEYCTNSSVLVHEHQSDHWGKRHSTECSCKTSFTKLQNGYSSSVNTGGSSSSGQHLETTSGKWQDKLQESIVTQLYERQKKQNFALVCRTRVPPDALRHPRTPLTQAATERTVKCKINNGSAV